jgi:hypothetical protein
VAPGGTRFVHVPHNLTGASEGASIMVTRARQLLFQARERRNTVTDETRAAGRHAWWRRTCYRPGPATALVFLLAALLPGMQIRAAASTPNTWSPTGSMAVARSGQTATLLPSGAVLVAGGGSATAELYDPTTGAWSPTGSMSVARTYHTATLLPDGKVLVAGGCCNRLGIGLASAEIYNPRTGTWTATGAMTVGRRGHTATLLPNGQVLVAGGGCETACDAGSFLNTLQSAELYNPRTRTWTATGSMSYEREFQTATLLSDGQVLVAGGFAQCDDADCTDDASAELYTPSTATWTRTGPMHISRERQTATLLPNGQVLVAGGLHEIPVGGGTENLPLASAELFDPAAGTWSTTASMATARIAHTATLLPDGQVLVAGGGTAACELYQPLSGLWASTGAMSTARTYATATLLSGGSVLAAGGTAGGLALSSVDVYTPGPTSLVGLAATSAHFASHVVGSSRAVTGLHAGAAASR